MALGALQEISFQTPNPAGLARFWQALIGGDVDLDGDDWAALENDEVYLVFVYAQKRASNRSGIQMIVEVDDVGVATGLAEDLGAAKDGSPSTGDGGITQPMVDPGGFAFVLVSNEPG